MIIVIKFILKKWFYGIQIGFVMAFAILTGIGVLQFFSLILARYTVIGIMLSLAWTPTTLEVGWLLWSWLIVTIIAYWISFNMLLRTKIIVIVVGFIFPFLLWGVQAISLYSYASSIQQKSVQKEIKISVEQENVKNYIFYLYVETLSTNNGTRNNALMSLSQILTFANYNQEALDSMQQVNKTKPYNTQAYWLNYAGSIVATHNWPDLENALENWQNNIIQNQSWEQLGECWNTATLFSPIYGQWTVMLQNQILTNGTKEEKEIIKDIIAEDHYQSISNYYQQKLSLLPKTISAEIMWSDMVTEVVHSNWNRAYQLGFLASRTLDNNSRFIVDFAQASIGDRQYQRVLYLVNTKLNKNSAREAYIKSVIFLAKGDYHLAYRYSVLAEKLAIKKGYIVLALTAHGMKEIASHELAVEKTNK